MTALDVYLQKNGEVTKKYYADMNALGPWGEVAVALFRAQKRSDAAKTYRRGAHRGAAYDVKGWSLSEVCRLLSAHGEHMGIQWGWKHDPLTPWFEWVLYVDLDGQCSFHSATRLAGPDYPGEWDRRCVSRDVIIQFCDKIATIGGWAMEIDTAIRDDIRKCAVQRQEAV